VQQISAIIVRAAGGRKHPPRPVAFLNTNQDEVSKTLDTTPGYRDRSVWAKIPDEATASAGPKVSG